MKNNDRILIDCRFMTGGKPGGIEVYTHEVIQYLYDQGYDATILISRQSTATFLSDIKNIKTYLWPFKMSFFKKITNPHFYKEIGCDVFYTPIWFPGYLGRKTFRRVVVTLHDCIPLNVYPNIKYKLRHYGVAFLGISLADTVITDSDFSKKEIAYRFPFSSKKIRKLSVPLPINKLRKSDDSVLERGSLSDKPYFLFVSALRPYKGFDRAITALEKMSSREIPIVVAGTPKTCYGELDIKKFESKHVLFLGHVTDEELNSLYKNALALVFPSRYEGFGLPIIEAQYHGCPVIATHTASIPEVGGDSVLYVMPDDEDALIKSLSEKMDRIAVDGRLRESLVQRGYENIQRFMPEKVLPGIVDAILGH